MGSYQNKQRLKAHSQSQANKEMTIIKNSERKILVPEKYWEQMFSTLLFLLLGYY